MLGDKLERRTFLKYCAATAVGTGFMANPINLLANDTQKRKKEKFQLSKPRWIIYENGSYDLVSKEIILKNCRPAINGQSVMPKNVFLGDSPKGKRIVYELPGGFLMLDLKTNKNSISIGAEFSGFSKAPKWFYPISQAEVFGTNSFFKQGYGTDGPSGIYPIQKEELTNWSHDSFMTFGFMGNKETIAIGNLDHRDFHQRFTIYNRPHLQGLKSAQPGGNKVFFESAMLLNEIEIENDYIKLPELHFLSGNKTLQTFSELAWRTKEATVARQESPTSYHWISSPTVECKQCYQHLKNQLTFVNENELNLDTLCINNYCIDGDWLHPHKSWMGGLDHAARMIYKEQRRAGISLSPFRVSDKSKLFKNHSDWLLTDYYNKLILLDSIGTENFYALDVTHPAVQKYISKVFRTLYKMGFIFYETLYLDYAFKDSYNVKRKVNERSSVQAFRDICTIIRTEIGPGSLWMADQTPYSPLIGFADIVKTNSNTSEKWNNTKFKAFIRESWYTQYFNNIYWQNLPYTINFAKENGLSETQKHSLILWCSMLGGAIGTDDNMLEWSEDQLKYFKFLEPAQRQQSATLPFWPNSNEIKIAVRHYKKHKTWSALLFNDKNKSVNKSFDIFDLTEVLEEAFVFAWDETKLSFGKQTAISVFLQPYQSKLFYISEKNEAPLPNLTLSGLTSKRT